MLELIMSQLSELDNIILDNYMISAFVISAVIGLITFFLIRKMHKTNDETTQKNDKDSEKSRKIPGFPKKHPAELPVPLPPGSDARKAGLLAVVSELEKYINRINPDTSEDRRKMYNQLRLRIEKTKICINAGDFRGAKRNISSAEMYIKLMVLKSL
ncbi:MAG: hypothetical protein JW789_04045 [Candidatus Aenigmarchaeota archaeon]|nr:hypothetical protein [Candidatus Aenigmarchaeota archaeon]